MNSNTESAKTYTAANLNAATAAATILHEMIESNDFDTMSKRSYATPRADVFMAACPLGLPRNIIEPICALLLAKDVALLSRVNISTPKIDRFSIDEYESYPELEDIARVLETAGVVSIGRIHIATNQSITINTVDDAIVDMMSAAFNLIGLQTCVNSVLINGDKAFTTFSFANVENTYSDVIAVGIDATNNIRYVSTETTDFTCPEVLRFAAGLVYSKQRNGARISIYDMLDVIRKYDRICNRKYSIFHDPETPIELNSILGAIGEHSEIHMIDMMNIMFNFIKSIIKDYKLGEADEDKLQIIVINHVSTLYVLRGSYIIGRIDAVKATSELIANIAEDCDGIMAYC